MGILGIIVGIFIGLVLLWGFIAKNANRCPKCNSPFTYKEEGVSSIGYATEDKCAECGHEF